jgi:hypothetical protein
MTRHSAFLLTTLAVPIVAHGQSVFLGRVLTDSGVAIAGAEVFLNGPQNIQRTNALGEFRFTTVPSGDHIVGVRMPGFAPRVDTIEVADAGEVRREYKLARIEATLPMVPVTATMLDRKLFDFHERRRMGAGRFLDSAEFANTRGTRTSDRLLKLPGLVIVRGRFSEGYVANTRSRSVGGAPLCRAAVWLDGVINLGNGFNVNEIDPLHIAAIEWYAGQATIPVRFAAPPRRGEPATCGVLVIWTR